LKLINDSPENKFQTQSSNLSLNLSPSRENINQKKEEELNNERDMNEIKKTGTPRISIFDLLKETGDKLTQARENTEEKAITTEPNKLTSDSSFVNTNNETYIAKGLSHFVPAVKREIGSLPQNQKQRNNSTPNLSVMNQRNLMKFAPGVFNKTIEVPMNFHTKNPSSMLNSKSYLRLILTRSKAQKAREHEQEFLKKSKLIFLNRASSAMLSSRLNKSNNSFSNPSLRVRESNVETVNHPVYIYQNASNADEKEKKTLIKKICERIQSQESFIKPELPTTDRGTRSSSIPVRAKVDLNVENHNEQQPNPEVKLFDKIHNILRENQKFYSKNVMGDDTGDAQGRLITTARTRSVGSTKMESSRSEKTPRIVSQKHLKTRYKKEKSAVTQYMWFQ